MSARLASINLIDELQTTLQHGTVARRVDTLRRITDLFVESSVDYSDDQIAVFDDVFGCLIVHMEAEAKIILARRLAPLASAPPRAVRTLAFDDLIEVAAPVLSQSERLDDDALIENARTKSQRHLLAISTRRVLSEDLTEVLVERGNGDVVKSTVANRGAEFSELGYATLLERAERDDSIATCVGLRPSIPRHHYLKLIAKASMSVRARLNAAHPRWTSEVSLALQDVTRRVRSAPAAITRQAGIAHGLVRSLFEDGRLNEAQVADFANDDKFDEASAAIACLAHVPVVIAETMMIESRTEGVFILSKVAGFCWLTVNAILQMRERLSSPDGPVDYRDTRSDKDVYERLRLSTAQQVLRFQRMQQAASETPT